VCVCVHMTCDVCMSVCVVDSSLDRSAQAQRSEPSLKPSEYNLSKPEGV
jgi:hypothetical protein